MNGRRSAVGFLTYFICFIALSIASFAQYRAGLQGVITDPSGAVVPDAKVTLKSNETNISRTAVTTNRGLYFIPSLAPGRYTLTVSKDGFQTKTFNNVGISAEQTQALNVKLDLGKAAEQSVTVTADEGGVETTSATVGGTISTQQVQSLPTFGRDPLRLLQLAPGSFGDNARAANGDSQNLPGNAGPGGTSATSNIFQTENQAQVSANGLRVSSNSFQIDGVSVNSLAWGGAAVVTPNEESIKEVRVETSPYSAENGRANGAQVMIVSKNGTNDWHGSALFRAAQPGWNAYQKWNGPSEVQRDDNKFNQWAGSVGGPVVKDKLFFFFSYETLRQNSVLPSSGWYETPQFIAAVKAARPNSIASQITGYPGEGASFTSISQSQTCARAGITNCADIRDSAGNLIGLDIGSPMSGALGVQDPTYVNNGNPGVGGGLDGIPDIMFANTLSPSQSVAQQFNGRLDFQATKSDLLAFSYYHVPVDNTFYNGPARAANLWNNDRLNQAGTLLWNHTFTPSLLNEARGSVSRWHWNEVESNPQEPWGLPQDNIDNLGNANLNFFGAPGPSMFAQTTYNFRDTATWMHGSHSIKFGTDVYWEQNNDSQFWSARPNYTFRSLWDFANDAPYKEAGNFDPLTGQPTSVTKYIRSKIIGLFVQDDYRVLPNLTLNLGLRWEYFTPITEENGNISNAILGTGANTLTDLRLKVGGNLYNTSKNNWGPQIGFAWKPYRDNSNVVVRGGFGIGYNRMQEAITLNGRSNPPLVTNLTLTGSNVLYAVPGNVNQFSDWPVNPSAIQSFDPTTNLPTTGSVTLNIFPQNMATPVTYRYSLDTQYEFAKDWVATIGYQGNQTRHYTRQLDLTWLYPENPALAHVQYYVNDANANYNALLTELNHRFSKSFSIDAQYRWAKAMDEGSNDYFIDQYPFNPKYAYGPADYDVRHNFKLWGMWSPTFFASDSWRDKVLGGWQLSSVLNWHSGFPWTPVYSDYGCNIVYTASGYCALRPAAYLGGAGTSSSNDTFMQPNGNFPGGALNYFVLPNYSTATGGIPPVPGVGRNTFRGPGYFNVDMALQKSFGLPKMKVLGEHARIELRGDFYNIFNKLNLQPIRNDGRQPETFISTDGVTSNPLFGQSQAGLAGRVINLQARFSF